MTSRQIRAARRQEQESHWTAPAEPDEPYTLPDGEQIDPKEWQLPQEQKT